MSLAGCLKLWPLIGVGLMIQAGLIVFTQVNDQPVLVVALWLGLFALMLGAWRFGDPSRGDAGRVLPWVLVVVLFATLFRATLTPGWPTLTDDTYRYLWDGRVVLEGRNPYAHPPSAPALIPLRDQVIYPHLNSPDFYSVYPPVSQGVFAVSVGLSDLLFDGSHHAAAAILKGIFALFDLAAALVLILLLHRFGRPLRHALLYAWNPLPIVEFAASGHSDSPMVLGLLLVIWGVTAGSSRWAGTVATAGLATAVLSKMLPVVLAPIVLVRIGWRYLALLAAMGVLGGWALLGPDLIRNYFESVRLYYSYFEFNAGLYLGLKQVGWWLTGEDVSKQLGPVMGACFLLWLTIVTIHALTRSGGGAVAKPDQASVRLRGADELRQGMLAILGGYLVFATTVHPWYVTWVLPLALLSPTSATRAAWVWLSGAVGVSYLAYAQDPPHLAGWIVAITWIPFAVLLAPTLARAALTPIIRRRSIWKARRLAPHIVGRTLLDVGAGEGEVASALARDRGMQVTLLDTVDFHRGEHTFVLYDGHTFPFADRAFDTVMVLTVLHHADDPDRVLDECVRVMGRRLIVTESVYHHRPGLILLTVLDRLVNHLRSGGVMETGRLRFRKPAGWRAAFGERRLSIVHEAWLSRGVHKHILFVLEREPAPGRRRS